MLCMLFSFLYKIKCKDNLCCMITWVRRIDMDSYVPAFLLAKMLMKILVKMLYPERWKEVFLQDQMAEV